MTEGREHLRHLSVEGRAVNEDFTRGGGGNPKIRPVEDRLAHGRKCLRELKSALATGESSREATPAEDELVALGTIITLEGSAAFPLKVGSLQQFTAHRSPRQKLPKWLLLSVLPGDEDSDTPERATVWVNDDYRKKFLQLFVDYMEKDSEKGKPVNNGLVANISRIRATVLKDLWQSEGSPPEHETAWWELWLRPRTDGPDLLRRFAEAHRLTVSQHSLRLVDRDVMWVQATWAQLQILPFTAVPLAEIRRPAFIDTIEDLPAEEQAEYVDDLAERLEPADVLQPAVCHLDTGVARTHVLLENSLDLQDLQTVVGVSGFDKAGHGTAMAGIALLGDAVDHHLLSTQSVVLRHRLESVRILPTRHEKAHEPRTYGDVTTQAVALSEIAARRRRVFCMPVSTTSDWPGNPGQPTLWSATVDALAAGAEVVRDGDELQLLKPSRPEDARLLIVSAGNITDNYSRDHLDVSDTSPILDPGQAWNALTVGACTQLDTLPTDPAYSGWEAVADKGDLSPHSRTSLAFGERPWPIKPDIVMEGGNVLHDGGTMYEPSHRLLSLRTTGHTHSHMLTSANATSAATAQASRLAALVMAAYPSYWPETVRAILVHSARWTPVMRREIDKAGRKRLKDKQMLLRRYGWGVPTEERVLHSSDQAVTLIVQDEFIPFAGDDFRVPAFRLHDLPWPREVLQDLGGTPVTLRVTLSYFIEPTASRRGWRERYSYASHGLRFDLQNPLESEAEFVRRVNHETRSQETGGNTTSGQVSWFVGPNQRHYGSLHQDIWETTGSELAATGRIAIHPIGGWWKKNTNRERINQKIRYSLVVSLQTDAAVVDLYTPVANLLQVPIEIPIE